MKTEKIKTIYEEKNLKPQVWLEIYKGKDGKLYADGVSHAGYSKEGLPFNHYNENLFLVIEADDEDTLWKIHDLFKKVTFHFPTDIQKAKKSRRCLW